MERSFCYKIINFTHIIPDSSSQASTFSTDKFSKVNRWIKGLWSVSINAICWKFLLCCKIKSPRVPFLEKIGAGRGSDQVSTPILFLNIFFLKTHQFHHWIYFIYGKVPLYKTSLGVCTGSQPQDFVVCSSKWQRQTLTPSNSHPQSNNH